MTEPCRHDACRCSAASGLNGFCSRLCANAAEHDPTEPIDCPCGHPDCGDADGRTE